MFGPETPLADPDRRAEAAERRRLLQDLRQAVAHGGFVLHYQPRIALATYAPVAAEAQIRWPHRRRGLVAPAAFLPAAEQTGLILGLGAWMLRTACAEAAGWPAPLAVSVKLSARHLQGGALIRQVAQALDQSGLSPERLEVGIAETMAMAADEDALLILAALRDAGIGVAIDEFGSGYASVAMLKRLPLSAIKLDRSLVRLLPDEPDDVAIVRAILATGRSLGLTIVADGIETAAQLDFLAGIGVEHGQGTLLGRPVAAAELRPRLAADAPARMELAAG